MARVAGLIGDIWPDPADTLLLRFLLHPDSEEARAAWSEWHRGWDPQDPTAEQYRLYALMAERVAELVPGEPSLPILQGVRRQSTIQTLLLLDQLDDVLATLDEAGLEAIVLKGPGLVLSVYDHVGQRPFHDLDILVDPRRLAEVVAVLEDGGWVLPDKDFTDKYYHTRLRRADVPLEVHYKHSKELVVTGELTSAWANTQTITAPRLLRSGRTVRILAPADALLHTIAHGTNTLGSVVLRWIADAHRLIVSGEMDWERVVYLSALFEVAPIVHDGLVFLNGVTGVSLPPEVLSRLQDVRVRRVSRRRMATFHSVPNAKGGFGTRLISYNIQRNLQFTLDRSWASVLAFAAQDSKRILRRACSRLGVRKV